MRGKEYSQDMPRLRVANESLVMAQHRIPQIEDYEPLVGPETVERIPEKGGKFKGLRVANFNSTCYGGRGRNTFIDHAIRATP